MVGRRVVTRNIAENKNNGRGVCDRQNRWQTEDIIVV